MTEMFVIEVIEHARLSLKELDLSDRFWLLDAKECPLNE